MILRRNPGPRRASAPPETLSFWLTSPQVADVDRAATSHAEISVVLENREHKPLFLFPDFDKAEERRRAWGLGGLGSGNLICAEVPVCKCSERCGRGDPCTSSLVLVREVFEKSVRPFKKWTGKKLEHRFSVQSPPRLQSKTQKTRFTDSSLRQNQERTTGASGANLESSLIWPLLLTLMSCEIPAGERSCQLPKTCPGVKPKTRMKGISRETMGICITRPTGSDEQRRKVVNLKRALP